MKRKFVLRKEVTGTITIKDEVNEDRFSLGFISPNMDGDDFGKFMKQLKDGQEITISLSKTQAVKKTVS